MHWWFTNGWWAGWLMLISMLLFWALVIVGIVLIARSLAAYRTTQTQPPTKESALEILGRRYAGGEITREQYQEMRRDIEGASPAG